MVVYLIMLFAKSNAQNVIDLTKQPYRIIRIIEN